MSLNLNLPPFSAVLRTCLWAAAISSNWICLARAIPVGAACPLPGGFAIWLLQPPRPALPSIADSLPISLRTQLPCINSFMYLPHTHLLLMRFTAPRYSLTVPVLLRRLDVMHPHHHHLFISPTSPPLPPLPPFFLLLCTAPFSPVSLVVVVYMKPRGNQSFVEVCNSAWE